MGWGGEDRVSSGHPGALKTLDSVSTIIGMSRRKTSKKKKKEEKTTHHHHHHQRVKSILNPKRQRVKTKTLKVQIPPEQLALLPVAGRFSPPAACVASLSLGPGWLVRCVIGCWFPSVNGSDARLPSESLLLLLLGEVLSGLAVFGGLVGRWGLGGVCTGGQGVGDGHPAGHHAL